MALYHGITHNQSLTRGKLKAPSYDGDHGAPEEQGSEVWIDGCLGGGDKAVYHDDSLASMPAAARGQTVNPYSQHVKAVTSRCRQEYLAML